MFTMSLVIWIFNYWLFKETGESKEFWRQIYFFFSVIIAIFLMMMAFLGAGIEYEQEEKNKKFKE